VGASVEELSAEVAHPAGELAEPPGTFRRLIDAYGAAALLALVVGALAALMYATRRDGHWWGDDWALYLRQAEGLLHGHPNRVLTENEFTVTMSNGPEFSPPLYPWGYPIILTPFVAVLGADVDRLMVVGVLCACVFACCWFRLARRRIGYGPALVGMVAVTITPLLLSWAELIQSEWPFLAAVGVALVVIDATAAGDRLIGPNTRTRRLVLIGVLAASAFSVRREGLAMLAGIGGAQLAALIRHGLPITQPRRHWYRLAGRLAVPYVAFIAAAGTLQVMLPSTVVPKYEGTSIANVWRFNDRLARNLARVTGLQRPWDRDPMVLGSTRLGVLALSVLLLLAFVGAAVAVVRRSERLRDLHLVTYALAAYLIGGSFRSPIDRYVGTVGPILTLLAATVVFAGARRYWRPLVASIVVSVPLAAIIAGNLANAHVRVEAADRMKAVDAVEWGPTHPQAIEMFAAVERFTAENEVVAAPKARAMVFETGRPSIQVDDYRPLPTEVDIALIVAERDTRLAYDLALDSARYELVWSNLRFELFRPL
jgi:hypothetical protein